MLSYYYSVSDLYAHGFNIIVTCILTFTAKTVEAFVKLLQNKSINTKTFDLAAHQTLRVKPFVSLKLRFYLEVPEKTQTYQ